MFYNIQIDLEIKKHNEDKTQTDWGSFFF